jgi:hypothetical protein
VYVLACLVGHCFVDGAMSFLPMLRNTANSNVTPSKARTHSWPSKELTTCLYCPITNYLNIPSHELCGDSDKDSDKDLGRLENRHVTSCPLARCSGCPYAAWRLHPNNTKANQPLAFGACLRLAMDCRCPEHTDGCCRPSTARCIPLLCIFCQR